MQAARGTSLNEATEVGADDPDAAPPGGASRRRPLVTWGLVFAVLYAVDQGTKYLAVERLTGEPDRQLIGELLQLRLVYNTGAAFSAGAEFTEVLTVIAMAAVVAICWLARRMRSALWAVAMGFLLAGVGGNLTDRLLREPGPMRGAVVDFLMLPNWPVFNVADICINVAAGLIVVQAFRGVRLDGTRTRDET
jgi:signal peptidase II